MLFSAKLKSEIKELTAAVEKEKTRADGLAAELAAKDAQIAESAAKLKAAEEENGRLDAELGAKDAELTAAQKDLAEVRAELEETKKKLAAREQDVKRAFANELANGKTKEAQDAASDGHQGTLPENGAETAAETWEDALKAEGGDYGKARRLHRAAFDAAFPGISKN